MDRAALKIDLTRDEGRRRRVYQDTRGNLTIGIGHNLAANGVSDRVIDLLFEDDVDQVERDLDRRLAWWRDLDDVRQRVLANMAFNLGITKLAKFERTLGAIRFGQYADAARFMLASRWAEQVGDRAQRLAAMMRTGLSDATTAAG